MRGQFAEHSNFLLSENVYSWQFQATKFKHCIAFCVHLVVEIPLVLHLQNYTYLSSSSLLCSFCSTLSNSWNLSLYFFLAVSCNLYSVGSPFDLCAAGTLVLLCWGGCVDSEWCRADNSLPPMCKCWSCGAGEGSAIICGCIGNAGALGWIGDGITVMTFSSCPWPSRLGHSDSCLNKEHTIT